MTQRLVMNRYAIRRNPGTGRWIVYRRTGVRLSWSTVEHWRRSARQAPVYQIVRAFDSYDQAIKAFQYFGSGG